MQSFAQACSFSIATLQWLTPVPGLGLELSHDRSLVDLLACLAFPRKLVGASVCDSGTGSLLCYGFGTGKWQWCERTPVADIAVNRHQSSISSLES